LNLLRVVTAGGLDQDLPLCMSRYIVAVLSSLFWVRHVAAKRRMPGARRWE
jgi:hypothetical protein